MESLAKPKGASVSQVALAWLLADPLIISPIIGANSLEQLRDNLGAVDVRLTPDEKSALDEATAWKEKRD
jgi:aryl-alcohol dehydrogenase-like predicted oxidoreductase